LAEETGKTMADAKGDGWRGIEVVEHAMGVASMMMGETVEQVARGVDTTSWMHPLGVCAGITPFNFPAMIPLWMFPLAVACGNSFVLKPSEQDRSEEHTSELQSRENLVCRLLLEKKKKIKQCTTTHT